MMVTLSGHKEGSVFRSAGPVSEAAADHRLLMAARWRHLEVGAVDAVDAVDAVGSDKET